MRKLIDALESRRLLSTVALGGTHQSVLTGAAGTGVVTGNGTFQLISPRVHLTSRGTLQIAGTGENDTVRITRKGGTIQVSVNAAVLPGNDVGMGFITGFSAKDVKRMNIATFGGKDDIRIAASVTERATISGGGGNDTIIGGAGPETISGGDGNDVIDAGPVYGTISPGQRDGKAVLIISDGIGGSTVIGDTSAAFQTNLVAPGASLIYAGAGDDTITGSGATDTISGGTGHDVYRITDNSHDQLDGVEERVPVFHTD